MGRRMKEYVILPSSMYDNKEELNKCLGISYDYISSLSVKEKSQKIEITNNINLNKISVIYYYGVAGIAFWI